MKNRNNMNDEVRALVDELGGVTESAEKLGVSRQTVWSLINSDHSKGIVYLYALRYLFFLPTLRGTKAFRAYESEGKLKAEK